MSGPELAPEFIADPEETLDSLLPRLPRGFSPFLDKSRPEGVLFVVSDRTGSVEGRMVRTGRRTPVSTSWGRSERSSVEHGEPVRPRSIVPQLTLGPGLGNVIRSMTGTRSEDSYGQMFGSTG